MAANWCELNECRALCGDRCFVQMWQISVVACLSPSLEHQEGENIWQVTKLCGEKGKPRKRKNVNSCLFVFSLALINLWVTCVCLWGVCVCVRVRACMWQLALLESMSICLSRRFCFGFLAPPALWLSISVQASGT